MNSRADDGAPCFAGLRVSFKIANIDGARETRQRSLEREISTRWLRRHPRYGPKSVSASIFAAEKISGSINKYI